MVELGQERILCILLKNELGIVFFSNQTGQGGLSGSNVSLDYQVIIIHASAFVL